MLLNNNKKNFRLTTINKQKSVSLPSFIPQNRLLSKLFLTFKELFFNKFEFLAEILVLKTRYN